MIQRLSENDHIVSRYMDDQEFQNTVFPLLAKDIFETINSQAKE
jgi:type I restriction enzyme R subunit